MKSILITNPKGGCGKTTIATNLAAAFANSGLKTALVDTDRQLSSLRWLDTRPQTAAPIWGLDCSKRPKKPPQGIARLVIDSAAGLPLREVRELVRLADIVIIPLLPSAFDIKATMTLSGEIHGPEANSKTEEAFRAGAESLSDGQPRGQAAR